MAVQKSTNLIQLGATAGAIIALVTVGSYALGLLEKKIDDRVNSQLDCKLRYITILVKEMATEEQKKRADVECRRWYKQ